LLSSEDTSQFRYSKGKVVEPGTHVEVINKGDVIYYDKRQGYTMIIENEKFTVIQERDVVVVL
jgi:co-chaperonin GroES (HSP10)